ncbi:3-isopropylmalate dehydratase small subunit [Archangium violaceum]|uniref:3-isopropylmalate dehydratase small subunit n=1 Tax=Archangium violaceum TaxID=83451 RepID=UPI00193B6079|nr:3-isopropylmalate dehydratase small subunit [Archangium violaceum]QRK06251.1 3-isopropylmalate dehydratase small subunit [Archangium violaceum]
MEPFRTLRSRTVVLARQNIDTDQIIPARFLKITHRAGLGRWLFADWRYQPDGSPRPDFILEQPEAQGARVLVAGDNFGCGSSREHAPWALVDWGFRAVISSSIADIFSNNAVKNGLLPVRVDAGFHRRLLDEPGAEVSIDLEHRTVRLADGTEATFPLDPFARYCLMNGVDELGFLLGQEEAITRFEEART